MASDQRQALRPAPGGMIAFNLAEQIANAGDSREWKSGDRHAVSMIKDDSLNVLLMLLKKNALLHEHRTKGPLVVQVLSGSVRFSTASHEQADRVKAFWP
jgi:quercetin dioxygenase-like cupin family protein